MLSEIILRFVIIGIVPAEICMTVVGAPPLSEGSKGEIPDTSAKFHITLLNFVEA